MLPNPNHLNPNLLSLQISFHNPPLKLLLFPLMTDHIDIFTHQFHTIPNFGLASPHLQAFNFILHAMCSILSFLKASLGSPRLAVCAFLFYFRFYFRFYFLFYFRFYFRSVCGAGFT
ncbi:hypothetical protein DM02DRAFT_335998 [Periconia macrospinosa]|uniref:Uncharacterized protein n=1 Tax=Periconia macrospinosa TaxID=97972 RepID=A0A2V1D1S4_9PLEO|nr:hypothetical protein DM02DRAFT_335998 [Periconia macrospinosa]